MRRTLQTYVVVVCCSISTCSRNVWTSRSVIKAHVSRLRTTVARLLFRRSSLAVLYWPDLCLTETKRRLREAGRTPMTTDAFLKRTSLLLLLSLTLFAFTAKAQLDEGRIHSARYTDDDTAARRATSRAAVVGWAACDDAMYWL